MLERRQLLLSSAAFVALTRTQPAFAIVPVILAALGAITALALATGNAAQAMEKAVESGQRLWTVLASIPEKEAARRALRQRQEEVRTAVGIRREMVEQASQSQSVNARFVTAIKLYLSTRESSAWANVLPAMERAAAALKPMAAIFREKATWFPAAAQDSLAQLPNLYEARITVIEQLRRVSSEGPPTKNEEIEAWSKLVEGYDNLRVQSLKLITALETYTS